MVTVLGRKSNLSITTGILKNKKLPKNSPAKTLQEHKQITNAEVIEQKRPQGHGNPRKREVCILDGAHTASSVKFFAKPKSNSRKCCKQKSDAQLKWRPKNTLVSEPTASKIEAIANSDRALSTGNLQPQKGTKWPEPPVTLQKCCK